MSLRQQSITAFFWASSQQISVLVLNLTLSILLARILDPVEFGLIGMITIFVAVGTALMNGGLTTSLIRTQNPKSLEFSTVFYTNVVFSLFIYGIIYFTAPYISSFFERPQLINIIRVYSLSIIIFSFSAVQLAKLTKELKFKKAMAIQIPSMICGGIVGLSMAYSGLGVWSLVGMYISQAFVNSVQLWFRSGWRPSLEFSRTELKKHFNFGSKMALSGVLNAIYANIYNLVIGKYFSAQQLGYYTRSYTLAHIPVYNLQEVLDKVTYPIMSKIMNDDSKLKMAYKEIMQSVMLIILPVLAVGIVLAEPLFRFFLTAKWVPAVPYFQLICVAGIFVPLSKNNLNILKIKGKSGLYLKLGLFEKILISIGIFFVIPFGILGLLYFQVIASFFTFLLNGWYSGRLIKYNIIEQFFDFINVLLFSLLAGLGSWLCVNFLKNYINDFLLICIGFLVFLVIYIATIFVVNKQIFINLKKILKNEK